MKILITGASGFIGSFIVEEALRRGFETWAAVRKSSSKAFLQDPRIHFIELNLDSEVQLTEQLTGLQFDYVVHAAGVTKCLDPNDFHRINTEGTQHLVHVLQALQMRLQRFVYISSLSIITFCGDWLGRLTGHVTALNNDKYHILRQRNWRCDIQPARQELGYEPQVQLEEGVRRTVKWYQENKWL